MKPLLKSKFQETLQTRGSYTMLPNELIRSEHIGNTASRFISIIASYNPSFPGYDDFIRLAKCNRTTVTKTLKELKRRNIILPWVQGGSKKKKNNEYSVNPDISNWYLGPINNSVSTPRETPIRTIKKEEAVIGVPLERRTLNVSTPRETHRQLEEQATLKATPEINSRNNTKKKKEQIACVLPELLTSVAGETLTPAKKNIDYSTLESLLGKKGHDAYDILISEFNKPEDPKRFIKIVTDISSWDFSSVFLTNLKASGWLNDEEEKY